MNLDNLFADIQIKLKEVDKDVSNTLQGIPNYDFLGDDETYIPKDSLSFINQGVNASVWKCIINNKRFAFKIFFEDCKSFSLSYDTYHKMKQLPLKNVIKPLESFKKVNNKNTSNEFDAYSMKLLTPKESTSLLEMSTPSILKNISNLQYDAKLLADKKILMKDIKLQNSMFNQEDSMLYITDIDMFCNYDNVSTETILKQNYNILLFLIKKHLYSDITQDKDFSSHQQKLAHTLIEEFFSTSDILTSPPSTKAEIAFSSVDSPKQFLLKR